MNWTMKWKVGSSLPVLHAVQGPSYFVLIRKPWPSMEWLNSTAAGTWLFACLLLPAYKIQISLVRAATEDLFAFVQNMKSYPVV